MTDISCPVPSGIPDRIISAHGGGGRLTHELIRTMFRPAFQSEFLEQEHDGGVVHVREGTLAITTDGHVVKPIFFPGGDIGMLAVNGTINDLAMCGARPAFLTASFILEEGLPTSELATVLATMKKAADACGVKVIAGDTKVVEKGRGDGIYISTTGVGFVALKEAVNPARIMESDAVIVSGDIGRHAAAVMSARDNLEFEQPVLSDCAPLWPLVSDLIDAGIPLHCMRDLTRGGLASALVEFAQSSGLCFRIGQELVPVLRQVRGVCELLGLDPFYMACEGRFVLCVEERYADRAVDILRGHEAGRGAARIGRVMDDEAENGRVLTRTEMGTERYLEMMSGEQLPRIC